MAEGLFKNLLPQDKKENFRVSSAGIVAAPGIPASDMAIAAMRELGIDISRHRSEVTGQGIVEKSDLILAMTENHSQFLKRQFPDAANRAFTLAEYADKNAKSTDITDPVGGNLGEYRQTRDQIKRFVEQIIGNMQ